MDTNKFFGYFWMCLSVLMLLAHYKTGIPYFLTWAFLCLILSRIDFLEDKVHILRGNK